MDEASIPAGNSIQIRQISRHADGLARERCIAQHCELFGLAGDLESVRAWALRLRICGTFRYRVAAGHCVRALRVDLHLLLIHFLQQLPNGRFVCDDGEQQVCPLLCATHLPCPVFTFLDSKQCVNLPPILRAAGDQSPAHR